MDKMLDKVLLFFPLNPLYEHSYKVLYIFSVYKILQGTLENADTADVEWVLRPYMNTAKKRRFLAD